MESFLIAIKPPPNYSTASAFTSQHCGFSLIAMLTLLTLFGLSLFIRQMVSMQNQGVRTQKSFEALSQAKQALIAWSTLQGDVGSDTYHRPGTLPCPDTTFFGHANSGNAAGTCASSGGTSIGRFPWKTLGIDQLFDANGEPLWYAVSDNFRNPHLNPAAINSDAKGTLLLYAADGTTLMTPPGEELVAIIFSSNGPLAGQDRTASPDAASSFLDAGNGWNNATAAGPFITGPYVDKQGNVLVNDLALGISAGELISSIEKRALTEAQNALSAFALANGNKLPNPANPSATNCTTTTNKVSAPNTCNSDHSLCFGRLPEDSLSPFMPKAPWFIQNRWGSVFIYAVSKQSAMDNSTAECPVSLTVDGQSRAYVLIAPGTPKSGQKRPSTSLVDYLENAENYDTWTSMSSGQAAFSSPNSGANDQMRSLP